MQGPPGSGKTYWAVRKAVELMRAGQRVGATALSHKAINRFLEEVEAAADEQGFQFRRRKKCTDEDSLCVGGDLIENTESNKHMLDPELKLLAGKSFLFERPELYALPRSARMCSTARWRGDP